MENASYALILAGSVMVACMIIAIAVFVFNTISTYQDSQDDIAYRESISEFNKSFEAYDKSLMYGTDVLSCLNLAENNNQKYVYEVYQGKDNPTISYTVRQSLTVDVEVILHSDVEETIKVYYRTSTGSYLQSTDEYNFSMFGSSGFNLPTVTYYYFTGTQTSDSTVESVTATYDSLMWGGTGSLKSSSKLQAGTYSTLVKAGTYNLVVDSDDGSVAMKRTAQLIALLSTVTETEQTIYNSDADTGDWAYATWSTAVYDFKTKKFQCNGIDYNSDGYVSKIYFEEYQGSSN